jgi:hypothetical protein
MDLFAHNFVKLFETSVRAAVAQAATGQYLSVMMTSLLVVDACGTADVLTELQNCMQTCMLHLS